MQRGAARSSSDWTVSMWIHNPEPGGGTSVVIPFSVRQPRPTPAITSISPEYSPLRGPDVILDVMGNGFRDDSVVRWGTVPTGLLTTYHSPTLVTALISRPKLLSPQTVEISVSNPRPGGGRSNVVYFVVGSPSTKR